MEEEEMLRRQRKIRMIKKLVTYTLLIIVALIITPYILLLFGIGIMLVGALSMSPTINLLRFRRKRVFSLEVDDEALEDEDKIMNISWKESLFLFALGFGMFILSLVLLSFEWRGIIFLL